MKDDMNLPGDIGGEAWAGPPPGAHFEVELNRLVADLLGEDPQVGLRRTIDETFRSAGHVHAARTDAAQALPRVYAAADDHHAFAQLLEAVRPASYRPDVRKWTGELAAMRTLDPSAFNGAVEALGRSSPPDASALIEAMKAVEHMLPLPSGEPDANAARTVLQTALMFLFPEHWLEIGPQVRWPAYEALYGVDLNRFPGVVDPAWGYGGYNLLIGARLDLWLARDVRQALRQGPLPDADCIDVAALLTRAYARRFASKTPTETPPEPPRKPTVLEQVKQRRRARMAAQNRPLNTILYGPPGTGKTWATARRAVAICDPDVDLDDREAVMERYHDLCAQRRIEFVTFHQNYGYEEFVEGLRPETGDAEEMDAAGDGSGGSGFRLVPRDGVLKRIAARAVEARGLEGAPSLEGCQVFKVSLGRRSEQALRDECLEDGVIRLGNPDGIDLSDNRFGAYEAIRARVQEIHPGAHGNSFGIAESHSLRNVMREGDLVIASDGTLRFQAIGRVTGPYEFDAERAADPDVDDKSHMRRVTWLWKTDGSRPLEEIYDGPFRRQQPYRLPDEKVKIDAIRALLAPPTDTPPPHVLIIDEINRANISKVMGELITLLEEDKRAGAPNAVSVTLPHSGEAFALPANLHIIGTMNTADRSIALLDTALRRRFRFEHLAPDPEALAAWQAGAALDLTADGRRIDLAAVLRALNDRIEWLLGPDHLIGHAWFMQAHDRAALDAAMAHKVIPLLSEYFHEDLGRVRAVLGGGDGFLKRRRLPPPPGLEDDLGEDRWRYADRFLTEGAYPDQAWREVLGGASPSPEDAPLA